MQYPTLFHLPISPPDRNGWPWTDRSPQVPDIQSKRLIWPRVSIVTPSYNHARFLEETIRSVLLQGYPNLEYLVIDGGSTDGTIDVIRKYEKWITYWVSEPDNGQSDAINKGWWLASGQILAWINSDDMYSPGAIMAAVEALSQHPEAGMVYGDIQYIDKMSKPIEVRRSSSRSNFHGLVMYGPRLIPQPTTFINRNIIDRVGFLDPELNANMDYDFFIRISKITNIIHTPKTIAKVRVYKETKSLRGREANWDERINVLRRYNKFWFLSPLYLRYLRYKLWMILPKSVQLLFRSIRRSPRDSAIIDPNIE